MVLMFLWFPTGGHKAAQAVANFAVWPQAKSMCPLVISWCSGCLVLVVAQLGRA